MTFRPVRRLPFRILAGGREFTIYAIDSTDALAKFHGCCLVPDDVIVRVSEEPTEEHVEIGGKR